MKALKDQINMIKAHREKYHWVGIYIKRGDILELYPYYIGRHTPHVRIPISEGITINVPDVNSDPRYLVPIYNKKGEIVGEIDIDSDRPGAFDKEVWEECI